MEFFESMEPLLRTFWYIALPASLFFIIQSIMTFVGMDAHDGVDADFNSDFSGESAPFQLFSLRNLVNFMMGLGWGGICFYGVIENKIVLTGVALLVGIIFVALFFLAIKQIQKLAEDNTFKIAETMNKTASVYLTIPASKSGKGKIQISVRGSMHELDAMTEGDKIETGASVKVVRVEGSTLVFVEKFNSFNLFIIIVSILYF
ncbi:MAG: NfeD family protein [Crocinitomicaceae bacterium]|nr:NfeD family protein [Crocinitomicaceae bacterium]